MEKQNIIADIVGHPKEMATIEELLYMNPDLSEEEIRSQLSKLVEEGVVLRRDLTPEERIEDLPYTFYSLSDDTRERYDRNNLFPVDAWRREYEAVEKSSYIHRIQDLDRPAT